MAALRRCGVILGLLLCAVPAQATITHVANDVTGIGNPTTLTVTACGSGHLEVVGAQANLNTSVMTVSGNVSGSFTASSLGRICNGTTVCGEIFYKQNCGADTTITCSFTNSPTQSSCSFMEFAGAATSGGEDGTASGTGSSTSLLTGTLTSTGTADVVVGIGVDNVTNTFSAGTGFTFSTGAARNRIGEEFKIFTVAVNQTIPMTVTTSTPWAIVASAFKVAGGAACPQTLRTLGVGC